MSANHRRIPLIGAVLVAIALLNSCARTEVEMFVDGSPLHGANGVMFDAEDRLHIASVAGREIVVMDRESGAIIDRIGPERGVEGPDDLIFAADGTLYWTSILTGEVVRVDRATGDKEVLSTLAVGGDNLAFDSSDRLFVSSWMDGSILEILADGSTRTVSPGGVMVPGGIAVLPSGAGESVFVADLLSLKEIDGTTGEIKSVAPHIIGYSTITSPLTVAADGDNLILSSWFGSMVQVWDPRSNEVVEAHPIAAIPLNAIRFEGDLVVAELQTASVVRITGPNETDRVTLASGLGVPAGLAAWGGNLWVADQRAGTILQVVADGETLSDPRLVATSLQGPEGLVAADDGVLYVVEAGAGRLSRVNVRTGEVSPVAEDLALGAPGSPGMPPTWIFNGVAIGPSGAVYVTGDVENIIYRIQPAQ